VGGHGSISQGWRYAGGVYYRGAKEGEHVKRKKELISRMKKREELI
jgi:hypothetical protein